MVLKDQHLTVTQLVLNSFDILVSTVDIYAGIFHINGEILSDLCLLVGLSQYAFYVSMLLLIECVFLNIKKLM